MKHRVVRARRKTPRCLQQFCESAALLKIGVNLLEVHGQRAGALLPVNRVVQKIPDSAWQLNFSAHENGRHFGCFQETID